MPTQANRFSAQQFYKKLGRLPPNFLYLLFPALLGFVSGIPFMLVGGTLQAWGSTAGLSLMAIGCLTLVGQPYAYKFLWAPLLDKLTIPFFHGQRRGWVLIMMLSLVVSLFFLSWMNPKHHFYSFVALACLVAVFSATLDIAIDAFRIEFLPKAEYGMGNASYASAYRIGALVGGALALLTADAFGWQLTYELMALLILVGFVIFLFAKEPQTHALQAARSWRQHLLDPFKDLFQMRAIFWMIAFIILYKLGETLGTALTTPFLLNVLHFSLTTLGSAYKTVGLISSIAGGFFGGYLYKRYTLYATLFGFGVLQALGILLFAWLAHIGHSLPWLIVTISVETFTAGMATTVFLSLLMRLSNPLYAASQFALLSACASLGRIFTGPLASHLVAQYHWSLFFIIAALSCIPGLALLTFLKPHIHALCDRYH
jgi:PAT family beta-lactamase induction signal transducer AmpG